MNQHAHKLSITILALLGAFLAAFSLYEHTLIAGGLAGGPSICNINALFNCDAVNASSYSKLFGLPLAAYGLAFYLVIALWNIRVKSQQDRTEFNNVFVIAATGALVFSLYLFYISKFYIGTVCLFCLGMYLVNGLFFLIAYKSSPSFLSSLRSGAGQIISYPKGFLSTHTFGSHFTSAILYGVVILSVFGAPYLLTEYLKSQPVQTRPSEYNEWIKRPTIQLKIDTSASVFSDHRKGDAGAPISIVEFFDYQCGACRIFHQKLQNIFQLYKDKITLVVKNYPLDMSCNKTVLHPMHEHACFAASVARCAGEQGKFWEAHDLLLTNEALESKLSTEIVKRKIWLSLDDLGIDTSAVHDCVESGRQAAKISSDIVEGSAAQIQGTPSIFINGRLTETTHVESVIAALIKNLPSS